MIFTISVPEPFKTALDSGRSSDVVDLIVDSPSQQFGRGLARAAVGRHAEAKQDFESAQNVVGDACRVEISFLDLRKPGLAEGIVLAMREIVERVPKPSLLAARAFHIGGLAEHKLARFEDCIGTLLEALKQYGECHCELGRAHVLDSLGMVQATRGQVDEAVHHYAMSIASKALLGDREGIAISLGNMGRAQLQVGRFQRALDCFQADIEVATVLGDVRGQARILGDIGRTYLAMNEFEPAEQALLRCLVIAKERKFSDVCFFVQKDLVLLYAATERLQDAKAVLEDARNLISGSPEEFFLAYLNLAEGVYLGRSRHRNAKTVLKQAIDQFISLQLPDPEVAARIELVNVLLRDGNSLEAEQVACVSIRRARANGLFRYLPILTDLMTQMEISGPNVVHHVDSIDEQLTSSAIPNRFIIREQLGAGTFGTVFRVYDARYAVEAALKILSLSSEYDPRIRTNLIDSSLTELRVGMVIRHPGIVRVIEVDTFADGRMYILQDLVEGKSLSQHIRPEGTTDVQSVLVCLREIFLALAVLHRQGVIHQDIKPGNIMIRDDGSPVLLDFGIARVSGNRLARSEGITGTIAYMSPEQALGKQIDARSDIYSLGVVAYEWLTGVRPLRLRGTTFSEQARDIATREPPALRDLNPSIPQSIDRFVMTLLAKNPRKRPESALTAADLIRELLKDNECIG